MTDEFYLVAITALLPLTALMLVLQVNPYQALVMRGILGAIAALVYALFGAADVALTEALVGTMLSITLYAVAVRSSMEVRLGWVKPPASPLLDSSSTWEVEAQSSSSVTGSKPAHSSILSETDIASNAQSLELDEALVTALRKVFKTHHLRLELLPYPSLEALQIAMTNRRIHSNVLSLDVELEQADPWSRPITPYRIQTRVKCLSEILGNCLPPSFAEVEYIDLPQSSLIAASDSSAQASLAQATQESS